MLLMSFCYLHRQRWFWCHTNPEKCSGSQWLWLSRRPYGQWMSLGVEDVLVKIDEVSVLGKEQVEIFQGLSQEEALHLVSGTGIIWITHVVDGCVATRGNLRTHRQTYNAADRSFQLPDGKLLRR